jgi:riboflavin synthase
MFTGIIQAVGKIAQREQRGVDARLFIHTGDLPLDNVQLGDSIAVNGTCLTVILLQTQGFWADVSTETLTHTTLGALPLNSPINLEKALTLQTHLGGHLVSGHVDGVGHITQIYAEGRSLRIHIQIPTELAKYIAHKGSICVDGISLTVNSVQLNEFTLNIVPHTLEKTTLAAAKVGQHVNIEVDILARYLERLLLGNTRSITPTGMNLEFLKKYGFA